MNPNDIPQQLPADIDFSQYIRTEGGYYPYDITLSANQGLLDQTVIIDGDSDFLILGVTSTQTGIFQFNFRSGQGRAIAQQQLRNANLAGTGQFPVALPKPMIVPKAGRIGVDITELTGAPNTVQLVFIGIRLYRN